ncbi:MAG: 8-amino-7-oxononanoate synthase [Verrucomicrobia bacterium]|nr:8-amino-7-oxononanoate synthase [Verrucomicrobiota bacterium]
MPELDETLAGELADWSIAGLRRELRRVAATSGTRLVVEGLELINFASNDYLGLLHHPELQEAAVRALRDWGSGSGASRLVSGSLALHHELEESLAHWKGTSAALTFGSGYATALGVIPALLGSDDVVILDKRVHACCVDGARLSKATLRVFRHNDLESLEDVLKWADQRRGSGKSRILIVTESVFSMDGDQAPLPGIVQLKDRYGAWLMVDEAHALGLFGTARSGLIRALELDAHVEIQMGTLGKALASAGGYVAGSRALIDFLIHRARSFMFSTAPAPAAVASAQAALKLIQGSEGAQRCSQVWAIARQLAAKLQPGRPPTSAILPLILGPADAAMVAAARLRSQGIWVPAIRYPTVARDSARLRFSVTAGHELTDLQCLLEVLPAGSNLTAAEA